MYTYTLLNDKREGVSTWYEDNGEKHITEYHNGMMGKCEVYSANGVLLSRIHYLNNQKEGFEEHYNEKGVLLEKLHYARGKRSGEQQTFYENGKLETSVSYKNGIFEGESKVYYPSGVLHSVAHYKNGAFEREEEYDINGKLIKTRFFKDGALIEKTDKDKP